MAAAVIIASSLGNGHILTSLNYFSLSCSTCFPGTRCFISHRLYWLCCRPTFPVCSRSGVAASPVMWGSVGMAPPPYLKMAHGWLRHVRVTFEVRHTSCINAGVFSASRWPPPLSSQLFSCRPHLCRLPELFVTGDLIIKWERCWVSDRRLHLAPCHLFPLSHALTLMKTHTQA